MLIRVILTILIGLVSANSYSAIYCNQFTPKIDSSRSAGYHGFSNVGAEGEVIFIAVPPSKCYASNGDEVGSTIYIVIDNLDDDKSDLKQFWLSLLLTAQVTGKNISTSNHVLGTTSGRQVLRPYRLSLEN